MISVATTSNVETNTPCFIAAQKHASPKTDDLLPRSAWQRANSKTAADELPILKDRFYSGHQLACDVEFPNVGLCAELQRLLHQLTT